MLRAYDWPGNVRELAHVLERSVALAQDAVIGVDDLPAELRGAAAGERAGRSGRRLADPGRAEEALHPPRPRSAAAATSAAPPPILGLERRSLYRMLQRYGIAPRGGA